ncbi:hypothetical protein CaCOL14_007558 [Colletotrichum acutatum]|uniref:SnoaL-like domain-containing protein n=1 Tax=Glomerella acutata TaxID=27357 RepID=A0AAD8UFU0_GLOAC|nr:uncharacterized protein BDZ83DRAFT_654261 [Colletotrichum acutatum]KAK1721366.1 hypothetical protein BDZ83DRAFT_654261 [Colletotrichum acutatum]
MKNLLTPNHLAAIWAGVFPLSDASGPPQQWIDLHSKSVVYNDHAFQVQRQGHAGIADHVGMWKHANPNFEMRVELVWQELEKNGKVHVTFAFVGTGTYTNDLTSQFKASGKTFRYRGRLDLTINEDDGLIEVVDEYYPLHFDAGTSIDDYRKREEDNEFKA